MTKQNLQPTAETDTRKAIVDGLCAKVRDSSLSQVRIAQLINELGINRNTFYYYFSNKYDVAYYAFRSDLDARLRAAAPGSDLVFRSFPDDPYDGMAYYAHTEIGARMLDHSTFTVCLEQCVSGDDALYRKLFTLEEPEFLQYVRDLWSVAVGMDIDFMLDRRQLPQLYRNLLVHETVSGIIDLVMFTIAHPADVDELCDPRRNPYQNILLESLHLAVENYIPAQQRRRPFSPSTGSMHLPF